MISNVIPAIFKSCDLFGTGEGLWGKRGVSELFVCVVGCIGALRVFMKCVCVCVCVCVFLVMSCYMVEGGT